MRQSLNRTSLPAFLIVLAALFYNTTVFSQTVKYIFDGRSSSYKNLYKAELKKSNDEINIYLRESKLPDLDKAQENELIYHPEAMSLTLVGVSDKFPIVFKNRMTLSTTSFERNSSEYEQTSEIADHTSKALEPSKSKLEEEVKKRENKIQKLTKRVQNGDMTAVNELQKVAAELEAMISGEMDKLPANDTELTATYFDLLVNIPTDDASRWRNVIPISGTLTIKQLDKRRFVADFIGRAIYESGEIEEAQPLTVTWDIPLKSLE